MKTIPRDAQFRADTTGIPIEEKGSATTQDRASIFTMDEIAAAVGTSSSIISLTYSELTALVSSNSLVANQKYLITDFRTIHVIPNTSVLNINNTEGIVIPVEPLIVTAATVNELESVAISTTFPEDIIHYTIDNDWYGTLADGTSTGAITFRHILTQPSNSTRGYSNVSYNYDFMNVIYRRWIKDNSAIHNCPDAYVLWDTTVSNIGANNTTALAETYTTPDVLDFIDVRTHSKIGKSGTIWFTSDVFVRNSIFWKNNSKEHPLNNVVFLQEATTVEIHECSNSTFDQNINLSTNIVRLTDSIFNRDNINGILRISSCSIENSFFATPTVVSGGASFLNIQKSVNSPNDFQQDVIVKNCNRCNLSFMSYKSGYRSIFGSVENCYLYIDEIGAYDFRFRVNVQGLEPEALSNTASPVANLLGQTQKYREYIVGVRSNIEATVDFNNASLALDYNTTNTENLLPLGIAGIIKAENTGVGNSITSFRTFGISQQPIYIYCTTVGSDLTVTNSTAANGFIGSKTITESSGDVIKLEYIPELNRWKVS